MDFPSYVPHNWISWAPTHHCLCPCGKVTTVRSPMWCFLLGWCNSRKAYLIIVSSVIKLPFFFSTFNGMLKFHLRKAGVLHFLLYMGTCPVQHSLGFFPKNTERALGRFADLPGYMALTELPAYYQTHRWEKLLLGSLEYSARLLNIHKCGCLFCC